MVSLRDAYSTTFAVGPGHASDIGSRRPMNGAGQTPAPGRAPKFGTRWPALAPTALVYSLP